MVWIALSGIPGTTAFFRGGIQRYHFSAWYILFQIKMIPMRNKVQIYCKKMLFFKQNIAKHRENT
ncbi:MAG: hypothetical protein CSA29_02850 [Desulfobacterales bacterium]|nr:MAG: hypothetical protein CSA29_02850 [Desulfobacterales bacterium]